MRATFPICNFNPPSINRCKMIVLKFVRNVSDQRHGEHKTKLNILISISLKDEGKMQLPHCPVRNNVK